MDWRFFLGTCILSSGVALEMSAPIQAVVTGMALVVVFALVKQRF